MTNKHIAMQKIAGLLGTDMDTEPEDVAKAVFATLMGAAAVNTVVPDLTNAVGVSRYKLKGSLPALQDAVLRGGDFPVFMDPPDVQKDNTLLQGIKDMLRTRSKDTTYVMPTDLHEDEVLRNMLNDVGGRLEARPSRYRAALTEGLRTLPQQYKANKVKTLINVMGGVGAVGMGAGAVSKLVSEALDRIDDSSDTNPIGDLAASIMAGVSR